MVAVVKRLIYLFSGILVLAVGACTPPAGPAPEPGNGETPSVATPGVGTPSVTIEAPGPEDPLANTQWVLESFGPAEAVEPVIEGITIRLEFGDDNLAGGTGGCNAYGAPYEVRENLLSFGEITSTLIACEDEGVMQQEQRYFQALGAAGEFELAEDRLKIWYDDGQGVLNFITPGAPATQTPEPASDVLCSGTAAVTGSDWKLCLSQKYGFEVQYPREGELVVQSAQSARIDLPFTPDTNLTEKYLEITATETGETCSSPLAEGYAPGTIPAEPVQLNDLEFIKETGQEGAAGSIYNWVAYSISQDGLCTSLSFVLRSSNPGAYSTPPPIYDMEEESEIFEQIVSTFRWLETTP